MVEGSALENRHASTICKTRESLGIQALVGAFLALFIVTMIVIFCVKGSVPDTLIQMTLGAGGVEAWCARSITVNKMKTGANAGERDGVV